MNSRTLNGARGWAIKISMRLFILTLVALACAATCLNACAASKATSNSNINKRGKAVPHLQRPCPQGVSLSSKDVLVAPKGAINPVCYVDWLLKPYTESDQCTYTFPKNFSATVKFELTNSVEINFSPSAAHLTVREGDVSYIRMKDVSPDQPVNVQLGSISFSHCAGI